MFKRILVANRGAVARRIIRACDDLDCQSVAVYSDIDSGLPHVNEASSAERLPGYRPVDTYLNGKELFAAAQRADVAIYPVGVELSPRFVRERWILRELAEQTGGRIFSFGQRTAPKEIYEAIEEDLRSQFRISYAPTIPGGDGEWRELEIRIQGADGHEQKVRTRPGYFAQ